jgi:hypothetical protein
MDTLTIVFTIFVIFMVVRGFFVKEEQEDNIDFKNNIFDEYKLFFSNESKKYGDEFLNSIDFKMVVQAVREGSYFLLDYKDSSELSYSKENINFSFSIKEIAEDILCRMKYLLENGDSNDKNTKQDIQVLLYGLSYLYKPKEKHRQRMMDYFVVMEFEKCIKESQKNNSDIRDVKKLPFPKKTILESLIREWKITEKKEDKDIFESDGFNLAYYQEGVGVEDLYIGGFDFLGYQEKSKKFPDEEQLEYLAKKLKSDEVTINIEKWEHFNKLVTKDITEIHHKIIGKIPTDNLTDEVAEEKDGSD